MNPDMVDDLERRLGKRLDLTREGTVTSLNDLSPEVIADARLLEETASSVLRNALLWFYVPHSERSYLPLFVEDVVKGGANPAMWERGGALYVYAPPPQALLERTVTQLLTPLRDALGSDDATATMTWRRITPDRVMWGEGDAATGSPAICPPALDYHWQSLSGVARTDAPRHRLEVVANVEGATRRWVASRLAWAARAAPAVLSAPNPETFAQRLLPDQIVTLSEDARTAINALLAEEKTHGDSDGVPGFRGPEIWYNPSEKVPSR